MIDYRKGNVKAVKDRFPMDLVSEYVYSMHEMKIFTKMNLVRDYDQMLVNNNKFIKM